MKTRLISAVFLFFLLNSGVNTVFGCTCDIVPPPCYNYSQYERIFVGSVKSVGRNEETYLEKVEIDVEQNFKGMDRKTAFTFNGMTSCSFDFEKGEKFLFYGNLNEDNIDEFGTSFCTRTSLYNEKLIDFDFLRKVSPTDPVYWIWGTIIHGYDDGPIPGLTAEVMDDKKKLVSVSDKFGNIKIPVSKEGKYKVRVFIPKGASIEPNFSGSTSELERWQRTFGRAQLKGAIKPFVEFNVEVEPNKCGWFHLKASKKKAR